MGKVNGWVQDNEAKFVDKLYENAPKSATLNEFYNKMSKHFNLVNHMDDADIEVNISEFYYHLGQRDVETSRNIKKFD